MDMLLFFYLLVFPFGQLGRFEVAPGVVLHVADLVVGVIAFIWVTGGLIQRKFRYPQLAHPFVAFAVIALFSLILAATRSTATEVFIGSLYLLRFVAYTLFYFAVWGFVRRKTRYRKTLFDSLLVIGGAIAVFGWVQYLLYPDTRVLLHLGWDEHYFRLIGTFLDPGFTGILLLFFTLLVFSRGWKGVGWGKPLILFLLGFSALALTYSRASYLAFLAGLLALYIVRRNIKVLVGGVFLMLVTLILLPRPGGEGTLLTRTSTVETRLASYGRALVIASDNPVFGTGFNLYRYAQLKRGFLNEFAGRLSHSAAGVDSSLVFVLATTGVVGLLVYLWLWWEILKLGWQKKNTPQGIALFSACAALLVHSTFNNSLFYPWVMGFFAILLAVQER